MVKRPLSVALSLVCFLGTTLPLPAQAALVTSQQTLAGPSRDADLAALQGWLDRQDVRAELVAFGVAPEAAAERVAALSDQELQQLAGRVGEQPAGGDALGLIGAVFLVLLILELVGVINVFNRI
jgi:hypothetical protein